MAGANLETIKILAVEDHPDTRALLKRFLENSGAEVMAMESGWAALEEIQKYNPDVLICDIGMPGMDGYQLLEKIRKLGLEISSLPAIACTAFTSGEDVRRALEVGFQAHVAKPLDPDKLVRTIIEVIHARSGNRN